MNEVILELTALLFALFCLGYSLTVRARMYRPFPRSVSAALSSHRTLFLLTLAALVLVSAGSALETAALSLSAPAWTQAVLRGLHTALHTVFFLFFALYVRCFFGPSGDTQKKERAAAVCLFALALAGTLVRMIWNIRVDLFFRAVSLFSAMLLLEHEDRSAGQSADERFRGSVILAVVLAFAAVITVNCTLVLDLTSKQTDEIGTNQLDIICRELQETITEARMNVLRAAAETEAFLADGSPLETISLYYYQLKNEFSANSSFMNVYVAGSDWDVIPDFDAPADFHAPERVWYIGAQDAPGEVFFTEPYLDANTGAMCFTVSKLLSDGETVVGVDLNFSKAQEAISRMTQGQNQTAMIVTAGGMIAGYSDVSYIGESADEKLPEYADILRRVAGSQEHGSFRAELDGSPCMIFSAETSNNWYLILSVDASTLYAESRRQMALMASVNLLMLVMVLVFYLCGARSSGAALKRLAENGRYMEKLSARLRELAAHLLRLGDVRLLREGEDPKELVGQVRESGQQLSALAGDAAAGAALLLRQAELEEAARTRDWTNSVRAPSRTVRNRIILSLLISLVIVLAFCISISTSWGTTRMNREADACQNQLSEWLNQQESLLYMFTDMISAAPELVEDYNSAVGLLDNIARRYPDISLCFLANPYAEHPVIMSNGWVPGEDYRPETRPWYRTTERSAEGFSISSPYLDARSGNYCITFSRIVYGTKGEFLGIFGIDFYLDKLIRVLGESYTSRSYAFLVDSEDVIINHPHDAYQMREDAGVSIEDTEYAEVYNREGVTMLRDYAGGLMAGLSRRTASGFTVVVADRWWDIYGSVVLVTAVFLMLFTLCLVFIISLINRLIRWQAEVNRQLVDAAEAAQSANRAKSRFLSQMSHEIRTPMNAIIGLDIIALRDQSISPQTRGELEKIGASARHLLALINDILDMSRIESGRMELRSEAFSFREFLEQICVIVGGQCEDKGLRFVYSRGEAMEEAYVGDDLKLKQVLINILGNAVKFTDPPGVITFTAEQMACTADSATLRFTMEDTGVGMDREFLPHIFEAFSQEDSGSTTRYGGSGLGMAITKNIVEMMGGEIAVESEKGLGSTFTVTVTLGRTEAPQPSRSAAAEEPTESVSLEGRHMLIAEDQEVNAEVLADLLELEDMSSEWAENGERAVARFTESEPGHFDAILMDMRMPVMDGLAATRAIRKLERPDAQTIPIIALTANAFEEDVRQCLEAGMNAHLSKPVDIDRLKQTLSRLLNPRQ